MQNNTNSVVLHLHGMSCSSCAGRIENALRDVPGVRDVGVHLLNEKALVQGDALDLQALLDAVKQAGYRASVENAHPEKAAVAPKSKPAAAPPAAANYSAVQPATQPAPPLQNAAHNHWPTQFLPVLTLALALALALPLVLPMLLMPFGIHWHLPVLWQWALATPVQFVCGARFYKGAWQALRARHGTMDLLVALGTSAAYGLSLWLWWQHGAAASSQVYFESSAVVVALVLLGKWLEGRAKNRTNAALQGLAQLQPATATVERNAADGGKYLETLATSQLQRGDVVVVPAGQHIAVDGTVQAGSSHVDEALLTGESLPLAKHPGDAVRAGSVNGEATLWVSTEHVGEHTLLGRIMAQVEAAQSTKAPIQRLADRVSAVFVPVVVAIALATALISLAFGLSGEEAIVRAVAVLVISCPCALGLATPTAIVVGTGLAAQHGIFIHTAQALETTHRLSAIVLDKTGTLTQGQPTVQAMAHTQHCDTPRLLSLATHALQHSTHPLAQAVLNHAAALLSHASVLGAHEGSMLVVAGCGVSGMVDGQQLRLGTANWLRQEGVRLDNEAIMNQDVAQWLDKGHTVSLLAMDNFLYGAFAFADPLKPNAKATLQTLRSMGLSLHLQSGDNPKAVQHLAQALGIDNAKGAALPADKLAYIKALQAQGECVAMVGDGVNDAPALAQADVGMAMATGTDVANHLASISLLGGNLQGIPLAIHIARKTYRTIQQNLFWAFAYNVVGIPLAALGYLSPMVAGAAMAFSSLLVLGNALVLQLRFKP